MDTPLLIGIMCVFFYFRMVIFLEDTPILNHATNVCYILNNTYVPYIVLRLHKCVYALAGY